MANSSRKKTAKTKTEKPVENTAAVEETDVQEENVVISREDAAKEEAKEENTSAETKNDGIETSEETVPEAAQPDSDAKTAKTPEEEPRKKRKYTRRASSKTEDSKTDEKASKKSKKDSKLVEKIQEVYIEFQEEKILSEEIIDRIKEAYKNEGHRISSIKKLQVYMNIDARKAYYVINDKPEGKSVDF